MKKLTKVSLNPLDVPVKYRLLPLHIMETTERIMGTIRTRYLDAIKNMIFGASIR